VSEGKISCTQWLDLGCTEWVQSDKFSQIRASEKGWFFTRTGQAFCPSHNPEWVGEWKETRDMGARTAQLTRVGRVLGTFMEGDLMELCLDFMADRGSSLANYREDLGDRVQRYIKVMERNDDDGYVEIEVWLTGHAEPERRYRVQITIQEQQI
jgi:hypothetical protein